MFDFGIGASELLFIAIVALIVVGPKDLPRLLRTIGQYTRKIRGLAREFQTHLDEAAKESGIDEVKKEVKDMTNFTVTSDLDKQGADIKRAIEASAPKPAGQSEPKQPGEAKAEPAPARIEPGKAEKDKPEPADDKPAPAAKAPAPAAKAKPDKSKADKPKAADKPKPKKANVTAKASRDSERPREAVKS